MLSASLEGQLTKQEERKTEAEKRDQKGEKKNQKRNEKKNQKGQEEVEMPSKEEQQPQKPQAQKRGGQECRESGSEQVRSCGGLRLPILPWRDSHEGVGTGHPVGPREGVAWGCRRMLLGILLPGLSGKSEQEAKESRPVRGGRQPCGRVLSGGKRGGRRDECAAQGEGDVAGRGRLLQAREELGHPLPHPLLLHFL